MWTSGLATLDAASSSDNAGLAAGLGPVLSEEETTRRAVGTPRYMAPEQYHGYPDARADQYQLCFSLVEELTGRPPFFDGPIAELSADKARERFRPGAFDDVPRHLRAVLRRGLAAAPEDRWPDMLCVTNALERAPRGRRVVVGVIAAGGGASLVAYAAIPTDGPECEDPQQKLAGVWDETRAAELTEQLLASRIPYAEDAATQVRSALDEHAEAWAAAYAETCADRSTDARTRDAAIRCLRRNLHGMRSLVEALEQSGQAGLRHAPQAARQLPSVDRCDDETYLGQYATVPDDPIVAARVEALQAALADAHAQILAGQFDAALTVLDALIERIRQLDHEPLVVRALALQTNCLRNLDRPETVDVGQEAYLAARLIGDDLLAWKIATDVSTGYRRLGDYVQAERWLSDNEALVLSLNDPSQEAALLSHLGTLDMERRSLDSAHARISRAADLMAEAAPGTRRHAIYVRRLGAVLRMQKRYDEAIAILERSRALLIAAQGERDPEIRLVDFEVGLMWVESDEFEKAVEPFERALASTKTLLGDDSPASVEARAALSMAYAGADRLDDAERVLFEAVKLVDSGVAVPARAQVGIHRDLGRLRERRGDPDGARRHLNRARAMAERLDASPLRTRTLEDLDKRLAAL